jgi:deferrochelatase/peroxidase EfeB
LQADLHLSGQRDLGLNGSYLVYRQIAQDVRGFWRWVAKEAAHLGSATEELAETMVGRRLDGRPLEDLTRGRSIPGVEPDDSELNGFLFDTDPDGLGCPIGAHIRRANPRSGDAPAGRTSPLDYFLSMLGLTARRAHRPTSSTLPWPRNTTVWPFVRSEDDVIASARFHRILRRGREYGRKIDRNQALDPATPDPEAGIHFLCLNANIARQFEFVQGAWIASAKFAALSGEQDPLLGNREPFPTSPIAPPQRTDGFSRPAAQPHCRHAIGLPQFAQIRGGAYFFLPGLAALKWIASD